ncbi:hypothetical protein, partial [Acinetobacter pittii]|uniref:hypothetical protein n=1 Tax=Acinetobacter pittii TaxID=48296 RepID=UPI00307F2E5E
TFEITYPQACPADHRQDSIMTFIKRAHTLLLGGLLSAAVSLTAFPASGKTGDENRLKINISGTVVATGRCIFNNHSS